MTKAFGSAVLICISCLAVFAPFLPFYSPESIKVDNQLLTISFLNPFGTDSLGRDMFSRILQGSRISLLVGIVSAFFSLLIGLFYGGASAFLGGKIDRVMMRFVDVVYIFPTLLLAMLISLFSGQGLLGILLAIALSSWVNQARLSRAAVLQAKSLLFVESARALGAKPKTVFLKHVLPQAWGPVVIATVFQVPQNILTESFLSFIGLGLQPPIASWGTMINEGWKAIDSYPHLLFGPGIFLFITMFAFQVLGEAFSR